MARVLEGHSIAVAATWTVLVWPHDDRKHKRPVGRKLTNRVMRRGPAPSAGARPRAAGSGSSRARPALIPDAHPAGYWQRITFRGDETVRGHPQRDEPFPPRADMAPLLSAMETGAPMELHTEGEFFDGVPGAIIYPRNLVLIGTVNMDETTHGLSDKILDRAFVLEFWEVDLAAYPRWGSRALAVPEEGRARGQTCSGRPCTTCNFGSFSRAAAANASRSALTLGRAVHVAQGVAVGVGQPPLEIRIGRSFTHSCGLPLWLIRSFVDGECWTIPSACPVS